MTRSSRRGYTLTEVLVVVAIVGILSAAALPVVLPAISERNVSSATNLLMAELTRARDRAIRDNAPRGIRLIPDQSGRFAFTGNTPGYSRMIAIEPGRPYQEGKVQVFPVADVDNPVEAAVLASADEYRYKPDLLYRVVNGNPVQFSHPLAGNNAPYSYGFTDGTNVSRTWKVLFEAKVEQVAGVDVPLNPTSWFWNIRRGDIIRIDGDARAYTIVGPTLIPPGTNNPEGFVNWGAPDQYISTPGSLETEFLIVVDGQDNDNDGFTDESFDDIDNDGDGIADPGFDGQNDSPLEVLLNSGGEWEQEPDWEGYTAGQPRDYTIFRRPVPSPSTPETNLPTGVVVDLTTWDSTAERSRLPIERWNRWTGFVDIMISPEGRLLRPDAGLARPIRAEQPFFHFWITDVEDVVAPVAEFAPVQLRSNPDVFRNLPVTKEAVAYPANQVTRFLEKNRRLVTINTRTGQVTSTTIENFDFSGISNPTPDYSALDRPYLAAQRGEREEP